MLGQFDPFYEGLARSAGNGAAPRSGRLLLVAPNIVHVERELGVDPTDFRLWVCLHEETHRVQFTAVPWMRDHIQSEIETIVDSVDLDPAKLAAMVQDGVRRIGEVVRGQDDVSLIDVFSTPGAARGHRPHHRRDVAARGPCRRGDGRRRARGDPLGRRDPQKFNKRRKGAGYLDRLLRRLLGLDAKMAQYRDGAAFVRGVVDKVGMEGFNAVWAEPANLPSKAEIGDPTAWVRRVHG